MTIFDLAERKPQEGLIRMVLMKDNRKLGDVLFTLYL